LRQVTGDTTDRICVAGKGYVVFSLSPGAAGRKAERPGGRPPEGDTPPTASPDRTSARHDAASGSRCPGASRGSRNEEADLTRPKRTGKFYRVAPQSGREAELRCALDP